MEKKYRVKDLSLAEEGKKKIEWAREHMPVLKFLKEKYSKTKPLEGIKIAGCMHITKETAVLIETLKAAGAETYWSGCNPLSTQDDVAAALAEEGISIYGWRGLSIKEYYWCIDQTINVTPNITIDDGADLVTRLHTYRKEILDKEEVIGGTEETTTGVQRLIAMAKEGKLRYPIIAVNNAETKWNFDNVYGTGQSTIDGILRSTNVLLAGKNVVVAGYGHCGRGIAMRARGMGAHVIITEVNPIRALKAVLDGYKVMSMNQAARIGDIFITATGCKDVVREEHVKRMKNGAILCNSGHFNVEINIEDLKKLSKKREKIRKDVERYELKNNKKIYLLAEGRLVNLVAGEGHPSEVMDMSFANQVLSIIYLVKNKGKMEPKVYSVPIEQDMEIASIKLKSMGIKIDKLTKEQKKYLEEWKEGT